MIDFSFNEGIVRGKEERHKSYSGTDQNNCNVAKSAEKGAVFSLLSTRSSIKYMYTLCMTRSEPRALALSASCCIQTRTETFTSPAQRGKKAGVSQMSAVSTPGFSPAFQNSEMGQPMLQMAYANLLIFTQEVRRRISVSCLAVAGVTGLLSPAPVQSCKHRVLSGGCPLFMSSGVSWLKAWEGRVHVLYFSPEHSMRELHVQTALSHLGCGVF